jgi:hypothetical protein
MSAGVCSNGTCHATPAPNGQACTQEPGSCSYGQCCPGKTVAAHGGCDLEGKQLVFVTSQTFSGNLGGLAGADAACNAAAAAANLSGSYRAYLGVPGKLPKDRLGNGPFHRVDGKRVGNDKADLLDLFLHAPIGITELGTWVSSDVWVNTFTSGDYHCSSWTSSSPSLKGGFGRSDALYNSWQTYNNGSCDLQKRLYCVRDPSCPGKPTVDFFNDESNCGACGVVCPTGTTCTAGRCGVPAGKVAFVTSVATDGALAGLHGADVLCTKLAHGSNLAASYTAWTSDGATDAIDRIGEGPYHRPDGVLVASSTADLADGTLDAPIGVTESASALAPGEQAWTGTFGSGLSSADHCEGFTSAASLDTGNTGGVDETGDGDWSMIDARACDEQHHLYCMQDDCPGQPVVDFATDPHNCGACGARCPGATVCVDGGCHAPAGKLVFATNNVWNGNLGGLAGADAKCNAAAAAAHLGGTYVAWLSTADVDARDRIGDHAYYRVDNVKVTSSKLDLLYWPLEAGISKDENGNTLLIAGVFVGTSVYTGTKKDGTHHIYYRCQDWTSSTASSVVGSLGSTDQTWTEWQTAVSCNEKRRIYCMEL